MQDAGLRREKDVLNDETIQMLSLVCPSGEWRDIICYCRCRCVDGPLDYHAFRKVLATGSPTQDMQNKSLYVSTKWETFGKRFLNICIRWRQFT